MNIKDIRALIHLLDDPDTEVNDLVTGSLRELGAAIIPELESAWERSPDRQAQEKIENIIHDIQFRNVKQDLISWKKSGSSDLLYGICCLARYQYPDLQYSEMMQAIDNIAGDIWLELNNKLTALEKVRIMNHFIFEVHKFSKNSKNIYSPRNSYINLVLESKKGNPVSLAAIYIMVAGKLNLPVWGVNLPKIFILAYLDNRNKKTTEIPQDDILFYINPYTNGAVFGKKEIDRYLLQQKIEPEESFYKPCSNQVIIQRLLTNLVLSYEKSGFKNKLEDLRELLEIFNHE